MHSSALRAWAGLAATWLLLGPTPVSAADPPAAPPPRAAVDVDALLEHHWREAGVRSAAKADDATLHRRLVLDLTGRVPTASETAAFAADRSPKKYEAAVRRVVAGAEFDWHFATVLDEFIQGSLAGTEAFVGYLRQALRDGKTWDTIFREVMVGPWDTPARKPAIGFLDRRVKDVDLLTVDATRAFFGVDVSCARCHNHPLVEDWKREHYYGTAAFFARTAGGKGGVSEKPDGEAKFPGKDGREKVAPMMFLSGRVVEQPPKPTTRREALVRVALDEKQFFSRAFVNRVWEYFHGRGLVSPVDQLHSANPASVPALLDALAADFVAHGYDIRRLVTAVVLGRAYRLETRSEGATELDAKHFAVARLRPLSPRQFARSLVLVAGDGNVEDTPEKLAAVDKAAAEFLPTLDPRTPDFQSSTREALFVSNSEAMRKLIAGTDSGLAARLAATTGDKALVKAAVLAVYSRPATDSEVAELTLWLKKQTDRRAAAEDLLWALVSSAEFRFNH